MTPLAPADDVTRQRALLDVAPLWSLPVDRLAREFAVHTPSLPPPDIAPLQPMLANMLVLAEFGPQEQASREPGTSQISR